MVSGSLLDMLKALNTLIQESEGLNTFALMALFRLVKISGSDFNEYAVHFAEAIGGYVKKCVDDTSTSAYSIYVLFETIGYIIKSLSEIKSPVIDSYQSELQPHMNKVINDNRTDIIGYVFQIYAAFIQFSTTDSLSEDMTNIVNSILDKENWKADLKYLAPAQSKILQAVAIKHPSWVNDNSTFLCEIFQVLLKDFSLEEHAMELLGTMIDNLEGNPELIQGAINETLQRMMAWKSSTRTK